jgi:hypothetical protein
MAGGIMNLVFESTGNNFLTGNPSKTFFKFVYSKHTNFGLQKFRIDYDGSRDLRLTEPSTFRFKIPRHADVLLETFLVVSLPDIWSPVYHPCEETDQKWVPYEFRWAKDLGTTLIDNVEITANNQVLAKFSGSYLQCVNGRDLSANKREVFDEMTGNETELNNPASSGSRLNTYPSAYYSESESTLGQEPSIRGRNLYIPLSAFFCLNSKLALPLVAMSLCEIYITVTLRPIQQLFQVRDVFDTTYNFPYVAPDFTKQEFQMYRFLQSPPYERIDASYYQNKLNEWNADVHLMSTYAFLSTDETRMLASEPQTYLVRDVIEYTHQNITGTKRVELKSQGMVSNWMFFFRRNDANLRNEWSNYTNWPYSSMPNDVVLPPEESESVYSTLLFDDAGTAASTGPRTHPSGEGTNIYITGPLKESNRKEILMSFAVVLDGSYRENTLPSGVVSYLENFARCDGKLPDGVYIYNFGLNPSIHCMQPSGAMNLSAFRSIELEISTHLPTVDTTASNLQFICSDGGNIIGVRKENWRLFEYTYDLTVLEERFNVITVQNGTCKALLAR